LESQETVREGEFAGVDLSKITDFSTSHEVYEVIKTVCLNIIQALLTDR
jgi:hypothetical protein